MEGLKKAHPPTRKQERPKKTALWRAVKAANPDLADEDVDAALDRAAAMERNLVLTSGLNFDQVREIVRSELFPDGEAE